MKINIIVPTHSEGDFLSDKLREITKKIYEKLEISPCFGFGGPDGYGENYENSTFMMHRFCWCENENCPWCMHCDCELHYLVDGKETNYNGWMKFYMQYVYGHQYDENTKISEIPLQVLHSDEYKIKSEEANERRTITVDHTCKVCKGLDEKTGAIPCKNAPNFWHKSSGFRIWWYKWIGRDIEIYNSSHISTGNIMDECLKSI